MTRQREKDRYNNKLFCFFCLLFLTLHPKKPFYCCNSENKNSFSSHTLLLSLTEITQKVTEEWLFYRRLLQIRHSCSIFVLQLFQSARTRHLEAMLSDCRWLLKIYAKSFQQALRQITPGTSGQTQTKRVEREWDGDRKHICQGSKALTSLHKSTRLTLPSLATHFPVTQSDQWMRRPNRWTDIIPPHPPPLLNHEVITVKQQDA